MRPARAQQGFGPNIVGSWLERFCFPLFKAAWVPANPPTDGLTLVAEFGDREFMSVSVADGRFYVTMPGPRLRVLEPADEPGVGPTSVDVDLTELGWAGKVVVQGALAYVLSEAGLRVVDLSNPSAPDMLGTYQEEAPPGSWQSMAVGGSLAAWSHSRGAPSNRNVTLALSLVDVSDPHAPRRSSSIDFPEGSDNVGDLALAGSLMYVAARQSGLYIFDVAEERGRLITPPLLVPGSSDLARSR